MPVTNERMGLDPKIGCRPYGRASSSYVMQLDQVNLALHPLVFGRKVFRIQYKHSTNLVEVVVQEGQGLQVS